MNTTGTGCAMTVSQPSKAMPVFQSKIKDFSLYHGNCMEVMAQLPEQSVDLIFADPPYFLSNDGISCQSGKMVSVNKGKWDRSMGFAGNYQFTKEWIAQCQRLLKPNGSIMISGTSHIIHIVGCCLDELGFKILNDITWQKAAPPPNLSCRYFTHATETIIWAGRDKKTKHKFNYADMKKANGDKQMTSVWKFSAPGKDEKIYGKHPTQKPLALLERIVLAASSPGDVVLDPFSGSATTGLAAIRNNRSYIGIEMDAQYIDLSIKRYGDEVGKIISYLASLPPTRRHREEERISA
jgi:site-specific DNA-methyltransferase (adenine-specific)